MAIKYFILLLFFSFNICFADTIAELYNKANIFQNDNNYSEAINVYNIIVSSYPNSKWTDASFYMIGESFYSLGLYKKAINNGYNKIILKYPNSTLVEDSIYMIGKCYINIGEYKSSVLEYKKLLKLFPNSSWKKEAEKIISKYIVKKPTKIIVDNRTEEEKEYLKALSFHSQNDFENAFTSYENIIKKYPLSSNIGNYYFMIAELCGLNQKYKSALKFYMNSIKYGDRILKGNTQYKIGETYYHIKDYSNAILAYEKVIKDYSESDMLIDSMYMAGECAIKLKRFNKAKKLYLKIIKRYPKTFWLSDIRKNLSKIDIKLKTKLKKNIVITKYDIKDKAKLHYENALKYKRMKKYYLAVNELYKCIENIYNYKNSFWELGLLLNQLKKFDKSLFYLEKEISLNPDDMDAYSLSAYLYYIKGNYNKAIYKYKYISKYSKDKFQRENALYAIRNVKKHML